MSLGLVEGEAPVGHCHELCSHGEHGTSLTDSQAVYEDKAGCLFLAVCERDWLLSPVLSLGISPHELGELGLVSS